MKTKAVMLKRACRWVIAVQGVSVLFLLATGDNPSVFWAALPLFLLMLLPNVPGKLMAVGLGLASAPGGFNPPPYPHPILGAVVTFAGSTVFWVSLVWLFQVLNSGGDE